jgi:hypothetical protein
MKFGLTLREENRWTAFKNTMPCEILGPEGEKVTGEGRKLQEEDLICDFYLLSIIRLIRSWRMRGQGLWHIWAEYKGMRGFGKSEVRRRFERPECRWEGNITNGF